MHVITSSMMDDGQGNTVGRFVQRSVMDENAAPRVSRSSIATMTRSCRVGHRQRERDQPAAREIKAARDQIVRTRGPSPWRQHPLRRQHADSSPSKPAHAQRRPTFPEQRIQSVAQPIATLVEIAAALRRENLRHADEPPPS